MQVLAEHGLDGTTIPRIAAQAGLTPGAIYRRFPDKNALLETVVLSILEKQVARLRALSPTLTREKTLPELVEKIIKSALANHRADAALLRGLRQFAESSDHRAFRNKAIKLEKRAFQYLVELLLTYRKDIRHPDPPVALAFALVTLHSTLTELIVTDDHLSNWRTFIPEDDTTLIRELVRTFLRYLGCD